MSMKIQNNTFSLYFLDGSEISNSNAVASNTSKYLPILTHRIHGTYEIGKKREEHIDKYLDSIWNSYKDSGLLKYETHCDAIKLWNILKTEYGSDGLYPTVSLSPSGTILFTYRTGYTYLEIEVEEGAYSVYFKNEGPPPTDGCCDFDRNSKGLDEVIQFTREQLMEFA